jgi:hypothetical protein
MAQQAKAHSPVRDDFKAALGSDCGIASPVTV